VQLKFIVKQNLTDQYIQNWFNQIENSYRGEFYGIFKNEFNLDKYLLKFTYVLCCWYAEIKTFQVKQYHE
jgi:hypothetical protein